MQRKGLTKFVGLRHQILYRKGEENKTTDALLRRVVMDNGLDNTDVREDQGGCSTMTVIVPTWYKKIMESYKNDS